MNVDVYYYRHIESKAVRLQDKVKVGIMTLAEQSKLVKNNNF